MSVDRAYQDREFLLLREFESLDPLLRMIGRLHLTGPGWIAASVALAGLLPASISLALLGGTQLLWVPLLSLSVSVVLMLIIGRVMMSSQRQPLELVRHDVSSMISRSWTIAALATCLAASLPLFQVATSVTQHSLLPSLSEPESRLSVAVLLLIFAGLLALRGERHGGSLKSFIRSMRWLIGAAAIVSVWVLFKTLGATDLGLTNVVAGMLPNPLLLNQPGSGLGEAAASTGAFEEFWTSRIVAAQRHAIANTIVMSVATGLTFVLPFVMRRRGWDRNMFRRNGRFDLIAGMVVPVLLIVTCVMVTGAVAIHAQPVSGLVTELSAPMGEISSDNELPVASGIARGEVVGGADEIVEAVTAPAASAVLRDRYESLLTERIMAEHRASFRGLTETAKREQARSYFETLPLADRTMAAMLVPRDASDMLAALAPITGPLIAHGLLGLIIAVAAVAGISGLMLISGTAFCEAFRFPDRTNYRRIGYALPLVGLVGPFVWHGKTEFWLTAPLQIFAGTTLTVVALTFFALLNSPQMAGHDLPHRDRRTMWNILAGLTCAVLALATGWIIVDAAGSGGLTAVVFLIVLLAFVHVLNETAPARARRREFERQEFSRR